MRNRVIAGLGLAAALAVAVALPVGAAPTGKQQGGDPRANPWGVRVVTFAPGTSAADMRATVAAAGGVVTTDLSALNALAVVSKNANFDRQARGQRGVRAVWVDRVVRTGTPDLAADGTGTATPQFGPPGPQSPPDPWHDVSSFLGETNPEGILQWDDNRMNVRGAWGRTTGDSTVRVAVLDTGVDGAHKELRAHYDPRASANTIPCHTLTRDFGPGLGERDCSAVDTEGHGTWVASRIAGNVNGFASNGVAPNVTIMGVKVLSTTLGGGLTTWIVDGMVRACQADADLINMSLGGYNDPNREADVFDTLLWKAAVDYCRTRGTAILASAGNSHVRINRTDLTLTAGGQSFPLTGVGQVDLGDEGIASVVPGTAISTPGTPHCFEADLRGCIETPAGIPGVIMVSATNNAIGAADASVPANIRWPAAATGKKDQLTYYSSYGSRIDITAPGGARKYNIPRYDGGPGDFLYGGWGTLGALTGNGEICQDPALANLQTFACFKVAGAAFGWLQGTSMSSPNAAGVAALVLAAQHGLQENPDGLLARLRATARTDMVNLMGPNDPTNLAPSYFGVACPTGFCHIDFTHPISFADAYGAGMVDATAAVG